MGRPCTGATVGYMGRALRSTQPPPPPSAHAKHAEAVPYSPAITHSRTHTHGQQAKKRARAWPFLISSSSTCTHDMPYPAGHRPRFTPLPIEHINQAPRPIGGGSPAAPCMVGLCGMRTFGALSVLHVLMQRAHQHGAVQQLRRLRPGCMRICMRGWARYGDDESSTSSCSGGTSHTLTCLSVHSLASHWHVAVSTTPDGERVHDSR